MAINLNSLGLTQAEHDALDHTGLTGIVQPGLVLIEKKTLASPATSVTFSGLDGDVDENYLLNISVQPVGDGLASSTLRLTFNGLAFGDANYRTTILEVDTAATTVTDSASVLQLGQLEADSANLRATGTVRISAKTGGNRVLISHFQHSRAGSTPDSSDYHITSGVWNETATNITSIGIEATNSGSGLATGSIISLFKFA